jgi:hypothetical protein
LIYNHILFNKTTFDYFRISIQLQTKHRCKMKSAKTLFLIFILFLIFGACKTEEKAVTERKNLMMPQRQELKRNDKYQPSKQKQTYSSQKKKKKNKNKSSKK